MLWDLVRGNATWDFIKWGIEIGILGATTFWGYLSAISGPWLFGLFLWVLVPVLWIGRWVRTQKGPRRELELAQPEKVDNKPIIIVELDD